MDEGIYMLKEFSAKVKNWDKRYRNLGALALIVLFWLFSLPPTLPEAQAELGNASVIVGGVINQQGRPVAEADIRLWINGEDEPIIEELSAEDGSFILLIPEGAIESARMEIAHHHFIPIEINFTGEELALIQAHESLVLTDYLLERSYSAGFWIATAIFVGMLAIIALEKMHNALAALLAVAVIYAVTFVGGAINESLYIINFEQDLAYIDFEVIFLLMGMMIVVGIIEETGIFQWLAYRAYKLSRGKVWLMTIILMLISSVVTALLDNVTTMLLITPITIQIALAMGVNPLSLLFPALMASNVGGIATLIGTPTNILIGSYAGLGFTDFLMNLTPGVLMMEAALIGFMLLYFRNEHKKASNGISPALLKQLEENARIHDKKKLVKALIVMTFTLLLFIFGERIHLTPAVSAIIGAVAMLLAVNPDIEEMLGVVDWTTLVFFMTLFMVVGAVEEVGLIGTIAVAIRNLVGDNLVLTIIVLVWSSSILSGLVDNIPFTVAMLPAVEFLSKTIPGTNSNALYYALSVGVATGGNFTLIASSPNLIVAGISERAGYKITFKKFITIGAPVTLITAAIGMVWILIYFL